MPEPITIAVDFDGVIHSYTSGLTGSALDIHDAPVPGAIAWLEELHSEAGVDIMIHTCRLTLEPKDAWYYEDHSKELRIAAIRKWLMAHGLSQDACYDLQFWYYEGKPHADVYVDDRGFRFEGNFPPVGVLRALTTWNK